jgi:hypothetical protein
MVRSETVFPLAGKKPPAGVAHQKEEYNDGVRNGIFGNQRVMSLLLGGKL